MTNTDADQPCSCQSGLRYGDCHQEILEAPPSQVLDLGRRKYADRWRANAEAYERQGLYRTLAEHLSSFALPSKVIDVGCGRGEGIVALREAADTSGSLVVGLDENPDCLKAAAERLANPRTRLKRIGRGGRHYNLEIIPRRLPKLLPVTLAQTDLLRPDLELDGLIAAAGPYDAVTQWFTGIHPVREYDEITKQHEIDSDRTHRMATDLAALEYAANCVRNGGVLHVVTRVAGDDRTLLQENTEQEMLALARHGPVRLEEIVLLPYDEPTSDRRIGVGSPGTMVDMSQTYAASTIFRIAKPVRALR
jgi:SAM-dependent methyltransferase